MVFRVYTEKKRGFDIERAALKADLTAALRVGVSGVRIINRYDAEGITEEHFNKSIPAVFSEPPADDVFFELPPLKGGERIFAAEFLPGQFDQRADSAAQCVSILCGCERPVVRYARIYILEGDISKADLARIKNYVINAVEARECGFDKPETLETARVLPDGVKTLGGFAELDENGLGAFLKEHGLAMDLSDVKFCRDYFKSEGRNPTVTEIRVIDAYWSDHCRHTTFGTIIDEADIKPDYIRRAYGDYLSDRAALGRSGKPVTLMDIATSAMRKLKSDGLLPNLDESEEINACSVKVNAVVNQKPEPWLLMFKNETHNHPTEIEPFGGAATCLGGAIRDPLSGRAYVYQAMRVTGASDPLLPAEQTRKGKLPPRKITTTAAAGYSSYGNQIGLATGMVSEIYHPGYMAKRMELGAVIGATAARNVVRGRPEEGDAVILLGGRTGRDGCGGATGSSMAHAVESLASRGAEVQKGNAPEERKLQRLFRNPEAAGLIKRCNDFGAGGVSIAVGELADGLEIDLSAIPKKYEGLDGTELAISESQERMAVVVDKNDVEKFTALADAENSQATPIARVTAEKRVKMRLNGEVICDLSRDFLNSNGAEKHARVFVPAPKIDFSAGFNDWEEMVTDLNVCSQKGLTARFDSTVGGGTVLMPWSGKTQNTPVQAMAAKLPVPVGSETETASIMAWGGDPAVMEKSPFHGAMLAVIESVAKVVAAGGKSGECYLSFQEYFERLRDVPERWGKPFAALLGAYKAQTGLGLAAIGGKDSMSGSFEELDVPPTLISFAVTAREAGKIISAEFKRSGNGLYYIAPEYDGDGLPDFESVKRVFAVAEREIETGNALAVWALSLGGIAEGVFKMSLGNRIGAKLVDLPREKLFGGRRGGFIAEAANDIPEAEKIGVTVGDYRISHGGENLDVSELEKKWSARLEPVFKNSLPAKPAPRAVSFAGGAAPKRSLSVKIAKPRVLIPAFPGTNGEYDMAAAFTRAGGEADIFVVRNLTQSAVLESLSAFAERVAKSQIIAVPGGFSAGDEPEGSGKFIAAFFRDQRIKEAVRELLRKRDGLIAGICNGFQALMKLGLLPYGEIRDATENSPALTFNEIGRHVSQMVYTRICTDRSPWLSECKVGEIYAVPVSHGEGRFAADEALIEELIANGQIAAQYADLSGAPSMEHAFNPNGSAYAIESVISPDGRVIGKMGHSERWSEGCFINADGVKEQKLFSAGVNYFK
ncbi:MAG: phosphoribosylformylglycinamidine synthase [Oscillospiraceae bacterium]|jgi:phosphoribosylformylglycinamidine synthase|nr:phosphoribosylformylglycinamidine synthase [Oscillospiraceae bacterium]